MSAGLSTEAARRAADPSSAPDAPETVDADTNVAAKYYVQTLLALDEGARAWAVLRGGRACGVSDLDKLGPHRSSTRPAFGGWGCCCDHGTSSRHGRPHVGCRARHASALCGAVAAVDRWRPTTPKPPRARAAESIQQAWLRVSQHRAHSRPRSLADARPGRYPAASFSCPDGFSLSHNGGLPAGISSLPASLPSAACNAVHTRMASSERASHVPFRKQLAPPSGCRT